MGMGNNVIFFISKLIASEEHENQEIRNSLSKLNWNTKPLSFANSNLVATRPGFCKVLKVEPNEMILKLTEKMGKDLIAVTKHDSFHVTLFAARMRFNKNYDPSQLPNNLLYEFESFLNVYLKKEFEELKESIKKGEVRIKTTDQVKALGSNFASHLTVRAKIEECKSLSNYKTEVNRIATKWIQEFAKVLKKKGHEITTKENSVYTKTG